MRRLFSHPRYAVLFLALSAIIYALIVWLPFSNLILFLITQTPSDQIGSALVPFLTQSLFEPDFKILLFSLALALLTSLNIVLTLFFIRMNRALPSKKIGFNTIGGMVAGFLGLGCAACGSLLLSTSFASIGGLGLLTLLPLHGAEIGYAGMALLLYAALNLVRAINKPVVCPI